MQSARTTRFGLLLLTMGLLVTTSGCLVAAAGVAASGAAGYAYYQGRVSRTYGASLDDTWNATRAALRDLQMPVVENRRGTSDASLISRTANGERVAINLDVRQSEIPAEGSVTVVGLRIAVFGDHQISDRILDQIGFHLVHPPLAPGTVAATNGSPAAVPANTGIVPASAQTPATAPSRWSPAPPAPPSTPRPTPAQSAPPPLLPGEK